MKHILTPGQRRRLKSFVQQHGVTKVRKLFGVSAETLDKAFTVADGVQVRGWRKDTCSHIVLNINFFC